MNLKDLFFGKKIKTDLSEYDSLDLESYTGKRHTLFDGKGNVLEDTDTRDIRYEKAIKIKELRDCCGNDILSKAPIHKQLNAAAGRLTADEKNALNKIIDDCKAKLEAKKAAIIAETDIEKLALHKWED